MQICYLCAGAHSRKKLRSLERKHANCQGDHAANNQRCPMLRAHLAEILNAFESLPRESPFKRLSAFDGIVHSVQEQPILTALHRKDKIRKNSLMPQAFPKETDQVTGTNYKQEERYPT